MKLQVAQLGLLTSFEVHGHLDTGTVNEFRATVGQLLDAGRRHFVIDLNSAGFVDSAGFGGLVATLRQVRGRAGTMRLVCGPSPLLDRIRLLGLNRVLVVLEARHHVDSPSSGHPMDSSLAPDPGDKSDRPD